MRYNTHQHNLSFPENNNPTQAGEITMGEFFAGGGGWTSGCDQVPGISTKWILNHDAKAIKCNSHHHKGVKVYWSDLYVQDEHDLDRVDHIHASIECTQHSHAKGGGNKKIGSYMMGWELVRYIEYLLPNSISIENVREFKKWSPVDSEGLPIKERKGEEFERWKRKIMSLGYEYVESIRNAADDGLPTSRTRYFAFFYRSQMEISFPDHTHNKDGTEGKFKWESCRKHLNLKDEGNSIFGREFNEDLPKHLRGPLSPNSRKRIAAGIKKYAPDFTNFITSYYGATGEEFRGQSLDQPLATVTTANRHQLIRAEKLKFIMDHCHVDFVDPLDTPLRAQLTRQTKQKVTVEHFMAQYYGTINTQKLDAPLKTITTKDRHQLIRLEKIQFIATYFSSNGEPGRNISSLEDPLGTVMTEKKHQLVTLLDDFDIKARFLRAEELALCSTFPKDYFNQPGLKMSQKDAVKMIGNAVPPYWATVLMGHNVEKMIEYKTRNGENN